MLYNFEAESQEITACKTLIGQIILRAYRDLISISVAPKYGLGWWYKEKNYNVPASDIEWGEVVRLFEKRKLERWFLKGPELRNYLEVLNINKPDEFRRTLYKRAQREIKLVKSSRRKSTILMVA